MGFNCLKATATSRRQFTFYHSVPRKSWYSFYRPRKDERLSRPWSHLNLSVLVTYHKVLQCWKTWGLLCFAKAPQLEKKKNAKLANCTTFSNFFANCNWISNYCKQNGLQLFVLNVFETIFGVDSGNSFSKTNSKSYLEGRVPENQRNL